MSTPSASRPPRHPLTRERALREAVSLADEGGLEAVSMRRLAARLDVVPMALYKHVAHKEDLFNGMVDLLIAEYEAPSASSWRQAVRLRILSARRVLLAHPWARGLIESRRERTPTVLAHMDALTGAMLDGGVPAQLAHLAMHTLGHRIWGFSPESFAGPDPFPVPDDAAERLALVERVRARYPAIVAVYEASGGRCDDQAEFEFSLDLVLDAVERLRVAANEG